MVCTMTNTLSPCLCSPESVSFCDSTAHFASPAHRSDCSLTRSRRCRTTGPQLVACQTIPVYFEKKRSMSRRILCTCASVPHHVSISAWTPRRSEACSKGAGLRKVCMLAAGFPTPSLLHSLTHLTDLAQLSHLTHVKYKLPNVPPNGHDAVSNATTPNSIWLKPGHD